jgi:thioredoxin reductase (NADPH)
VVIATGSHPRHLNVPGEEEFYGQGVSYCATCDGPLFKGKDLVVVGCGNSGLQEGGVLLNYARQVTFVVSHPEPPAEKILQTRVMEQENSVCYLNYRVIEILGDTEVRGVVAQHVETGEITEIPAAGVFIYAGYLPDTDFVQDLVAMDETGYIETDDHMRTSVDGILAVGDVRAGNLAQITVAVGDGTKAAITAREYLATLGRVEKGDVVGYEAKYH